MKKNLFFSQHILATLFTLFVSLFFTSTSRTQLFETSYWSATLANESYSPAWSPDGKYVAICGLDGYARIYTFDDTSLSLQSRGSYDNGSAIYGLAWSPDGKYLAIGGAASTVNLLSFNGFSLSATGIQFATHGDIYSISWSFNGKYIAIGEDFPDPNANVEIVQFNGSSLAALPDAQYTYERRVYSVAWSPDGKYLATGGGKGGGSVYGGYQLLLFSFDGTTLTRLPDSALYNYGIETDDGSWIYSVAWHPDGIHLAIAGAGQTSGYSSKLFSFNGSALTELSSPTFDGVLPSNPYGSSTSSVTWSTNGKYLTISGASSLGMGTQTFSFNGTTATWLTGSTELAFDANATTWSPNGIYLAAVGSDGGYKIKIFKRFGILDGVKNNLYFSNQWHFPGGGIASGSVQFKNGFSLGRSKNLDLDIFPPIDGPINIEYSGVLNLNSDIYLGSNVSLTSSHSIISGNGHTIYLGNNLTTIDNTVLHISSDTAIDGQGQMLTLGRWSQIMVDQAVTLTLRNMTLRNTINNPGFPCVTCTTTQSKLALDNVEFNPVGDYYFNEGQLFIHNDVVFTGTSQLVYRSSSSSFIAPDSMLTFEPNTTLFYDTVNSYTHATYLASGALNYHQENNQLINMQDITSALYLDGCTLQVSHTGLRLTKGQLFFDNHVTLENNTTPSFSSLSDALSPQPFNYSAVFTSWSPDGKYLAVGGNNSITAPCIIVYQWDGTNLETRTTKDFYWPVRSISWSPDGKYLAVGGDNVSFDVIVYQWDGNNLIDLGAGAQKILGSFASSVSWSPDGNYLAVGEYSTIDKQDIQVFNFNGSSLNYTASAAYSTAELGGYINSVAWSPDGKYLAAGGYNPTDKKEIHILSFNGSSLTYTASSDFGTSVNSIAWSPDGRFLAVGGENNPTDVIVYQWDEISLIDLGANAKKDFDSNAASVSWSPDGKFLAVGGNNDPNDIIVYQWDGTSLIDLGANAKKYFNNNAYSVSWNPDGNFLAVGGSNNLNDVVIYQFIQNTLTYNPAHAQSIIFGNSALGPNYDLGINLLKNAKVTVNGTVYPDNVN